MTQRPILLIVGLLAWIWTGESLADSARGQTLYDSRCLVCHAEKPFADKPPKVKNYEELRAQTTLWDSISAGAKWSKDEVEDVVAYLNQRFYSYPCSGPKC